MRNKETLNSDEYTFEDKTGCLYFKHEIEESITEFYRDYTDSRIPLKIILDIISTKSSLIHDKYYSEVIKTLTELLRITKLDKSCLENKKFIKACKQYGYSEFLRALELIKF
jgi:predicted nucleic-acid-binding Zn-ribbon protein